MDIQELVLFFKSCLYEGLYCGRKGKRYTIEVVIIAKKLPLDNFKNIKNSLGKVQNQQNNNKETRSKR